MTYVHCFGTEYWGIGGIRKCLRLSSVIGLSISIAYIMIGAELITKVVGDISFSESAKTTQQNKENILHVYDAYMIYKGNEYLLLALSITLVLTNFFQVIGDVLLFYTSLNVIKEVKIKLLWILFVIGIILWVISLLCFMVIFAGSGILLLGIFLIGTCIRTVVLFILHQFIAQLQKPQDSRDFS